MEYSGPAHVDTSQPPPTSTNAELKQVHLGDPGLHPDLRFSSQENAPQVYEIPQAPVYAYAGLEKHTSDHTRKQLGLICGLRKTTFWLALALCIVLLCGVVGGAVGGTLARRRNASGAGDSIR
ncbi:MAG: hypothetical protein M1833_005577 [Piccolia ochrophora]|nr:MAG: hypothetical protein M1833_005577 [Piccolia ochrophora]